MSEPTRADLAEALETAEKEIAFLERRGADLDRQLHDIDLEAMALSKVVKALEALSRGGGSINTGSTLAQRRVLEAAAARFGIEPNWRRFEVALMRSDTADHDREELERLRQAVKQFEGVAYPPRSEFFERLVR